MERRCPSGSCVDDRDDPRQRVRGREGVDRRVPLRNVDNAYTKAEIVRGVDFGDDARPETIREVLTEIQDELVDVVGDVVASGILANDVDEALDELVAEGMVAEKEIETADGATTYYRLNTDDAWE
ncbi:hypothetical protein [Haloarcula regularis]|uniref:hypothetical protein n=1 Tax=Haloarcula regularis TaxID=3033392 RepID=UPI0023E8B289|nr:hypothetical protein [Halomicroarcula sp. SYNS111]